jgi:hypothetical protein
MCASCCVPCDLVTGNQTLAHAILQVNWSLVDNDINCLRSSTHLKFLVHLQLIARMQYNPGDRGRLEALHGNRYRIFPQGKRTRSIETSLVRGQGPLYECPIRVRHGNLGAVHGRPGCILNRPADASGNLRRAIANSFNRGSSKLPGRPIVNPSVHSGPNHGRRK